MREGKSMVAIAAPMSTDDEQLLSEEAGYSHIEAESNG